MRRVPPNYYKPWTLDEVSTLKRLLEEGTPPREVARELRRSVESFSYMMAVEKLSSKAPPRP